MFNLINYHIMKRKRIQRPTTDERIITRLKQIHGFTTREAWAYYNKRLMFKILSV